MAHWILNTPWPALSEWLLWNENQLLKKILPPNDPKRPQVTVRGWGEVVSDESPIPTQELNSLKGWMKVQEKRSIYVMCGPLPLTVTTRIIIYIFTREIYMFHTTFWKRRTAESEGERKPFLLEMKLRIFGRTFCHTNHLHKKMAWSVVSTLCFFHQKKLL